MFEMFLTGKGDGMSTRNKRFFLGILVVMIVAGAFITGGVANNSNAFIMFGCVSNSAAILALGFRDWKIAPWQTASSL
jgi:hypothetical protein